MIYHWFYTSCIRKTKPVCFSALTICSLMIPQSLVLNRVWMYFGLAGGFLFILIQLVLLVDLAHNLSETWVEKMEKASSSCSSKCWSVAGTFFIQFFKKH